MRLLRLDSHGGFSLTEDLHDNLPRYAILSHTWGPDCDEVVFDDLEKGLGKSKLGYAKLQFCGLQAKKDKLEYFWLDTCCINKANQAELSEAITSMFRWYRNAVRCYVYLSDVSVTTDKDQHEWEPSFRTSRWFTRGWTLQELLASHKVEFFSREQELLGDKTTLGQHIHEITEIPIAALRGAPLSDFSVDERLRWAENRKTKRKEDKAYCLRGIFDVYMLPMYGEEDNAMKRLREEIDKGSLGKEIAVANPGSSAPPSHVHWMVTRTTNPFFTGRDDVLQELDAIILNAIKKPLGQPQCRIVISGMGGQGKSELCLQLANRLRQMFWGVFWIDVSTTDLAERLFLDIAQRLSIPAQSWKDARLGIANLQHPWLLVLDNADDPAIDYQEYFPSGTLGVVLLTSRNEDCQQYATVRSISLPGLYDREAQDLLLKAARIPKNQYNVRERDAKLVASLLQSHPLALVQAGAYISRGHCTLSDYPHVYERQRKRLLAFRPVQARSRYGDVYATFEVSAAMLKTSETVAARDALHLLPLLAVCAPSRLPLSLFEAGWKGAKRVPPDLDDDVEDDEVKLLTPWHVARIPSLLDISRAAWDPFRLVEAVDLLETFSLVSTDSHNGSLSVSMHPLVHAWARDRQNDEEQHQHWLQMGCLITFSGGEWAEWQPQGRQLQSHIEELTAWEFATIFGADSPVLVIRVLVRCGWLLLEMRADANLFELIEKILTRLELDRSKVERFWLGLYQLTARSLVNYGKIKEAVLLMEQIVEIRVQTLAENNSDRMTSQHTLAYAYRADGQVGEAISVLEQVVKIKEQTLVENHSSRLVSQHELAGAYLADGQVKEAVSILEQVVKIEEQILREDHPDRLSSQHELARAYQANGQVQDAVSQMKEVVGISEQTLSEDHPDRLASQHVLARFLWEYGDRNAAFQIMKHVVEIERQVLVQNHPDRIKSEGWLEDFEQEMNKSEQKMFKQLTLKARPTSVNKRRKRKRNV